MTQRLPGTPAVRCGDSTATMLPAMPREGSDPSGRPASPIRGQAFLSTYATAVQGLARLMFSVLVGRFGGSRELLGQANSALSISVLSSQFWAAPAAAAGTRFVAERLALNDADGAAAVAQHLLRRTVLVGAVIPTSLAVGGSMWLGFKPVHAVLTIVLTWAYALYSLARGLAFGRQRFGFVAQWDSITAVTAIALTALLILFGLTAVIILPLAVGYGLFALVARPQPARSSLSEADRRRIDGFVSFGVISGLTSGGLLQGSQLAAHYVRGADGAGTYAAALSLATPTSMLAVALATVVVPPLVRAATIGDRSGIRHYSNQIVRTMSLVLVPVFGTLIILSPILVRVYGPAFSDSAGILPVLLIAVMLTSVALSAAVFLQSTKRRGPAAVAAINAAGLTISVFVWLILGPRFGVTGVALGYLCGAGSASLALFITVWLVERHQWWGLAGKFVLAIGLILGLLQFSSSYVGISGLALQFGSALGFCLVWIAMNRTEALAALALLRNR